MGRLSTSRRLYFEKSFWNSYARVYDHLSKHFMPYQRLIRETVEIVSSSCPPDSLILDAGCGTGNFSAALGRSGYRVLGFDLSTEMLKRGCKKVGLNAIPVYFQQGSLTENLPYRDCTFDVLISINALYMLPNPKITLREFHRVLKPGARLLLSNPKYPCPLTRILGERIREEGLLSGAILALRLSILALFNLLITKRMKKGSYFYWNEREVAENLNAAGFRVEFIRDTYCLNANTICLSRKE